MKTLILPLLLLLGAMLLFNCKSKETDSGKNVAAAAEHHHAHFYKVYSGKITNVVKPEKGVLANCKFNDEEARFIIGSDLDSAVTANPESDFKVYKIEVTNDSVLSNVFPGGSDILLLYNDILWNNTENNERKGAPVLKGDLGCIPKLIFIDDNVLTVEIEKSNYLILPAVIHNDLHGSQIAEKLKFFPFKINSSNLRVLNNAINNYRGDKLKLEGGLDEKKNVGKTTLTIYLPNSKNDLITVEMEM